MVQLTVKIGNIETACSFLNLSRAIDDEGAGAIHVYCGENDRDRSGYQILDAGPWGAIKELIAKADETINKFKTTCQLRFVAEGFHLAGE